MPSRQMTTRHALGHSFTSAFIDAFQMTATIKTATVGNRIKAWESKRRYENQFYLRINS
jgi:hypothetical protein